MAGTAAEGPTDRAGHSLSAGAVGYGAVLAVFLAARVYYYLVLGIRANPAHLVYDWQNLPLEQLAKAPVASLLQLVSQPPGWNGLLALLAAACGADAVCITLGLTALYCVIGGVSAVLMLHLLRLLSVDLRLATVAVSVWAASPVAVFYENYPFYPQLTMALILVVFVALAHMSRGGREAWLWIAVLGAALLGWVWTLFHPAFVVLAFAMALFVSRRAPGRRDWLALGLSLSLALLPSMKNQAIAGQFLNGGWLGLNLSQVAPVAPEVDGVPCGFESALAMAERRHGITHPGSALNHPEVLEFAARCAPEALSAIRAKPGAFLSGRLEQAGKSLSELPHHFFMPPLGWSRHFADQPSEGGRVLIGLLYTLVGLALALNLAIPGRGWHVRLSLCGLGLILYVLLIGHAVNGGEQQRMRYTVEPILFVLTIAAFHRLRFAGRRGTVDAAVCPRRHSEAEDGAVRQPPG